MTKSKLLLPASLLTYKAAVQAGADEIYLGAEKFGARSFAENFNLSSLEEAVNYCHLRNVSVHLTLNTLIKPGEIKEFASLAEKAMRIGVDAFIVQDIAAARMLIDAGFQVHASTQLTVHNKEGAEFAKDFGFSRVVLSREMSKKEIAEIIKSVDIETEIFVHGALCMCYSGQCLMSSVIGGRSANRGRCAQPCRLPYTLSENGKKIAAGYFLNPYDLALIDNTENISRLGVTSLKIEGRMKGAQYVAAAAYEYRNALDGKEYDIDVLKSAFCRGGRFTCGGFENAKGKSIISYKKGNDDIYDRDTKKLEFLNLYIENDANIKRLPVNAQVFIIPRKEMSLVLRCGEFEARVFGQIAEDASKRPLSHEDISKCMNKTGDVPFYIKNIDIISENAFAPVSALNALRRDGFNLLSKKITESFKKSLTVTPPQELHFQAAHTPKLNIWVSSKEQLDAVKGCSYDEIFVPLDIYSGNGYCIMPDIIHDVSYYMSEIKKRNITKIATGNLGLINEALKSGLDVYLTYGANVFSKYSENEWLKRGVNGVQVSPELSLKELDFSEKSSAIVYGKIIMMKTANCPAYTYSGKCGGKNYSLTDRKNETFTLKSDCRECVSYIYNSKPVYMADKLSLIKNIGGLDMVFTDENYDLTAKILDLYKKREPAPFDFTRGHFMRGVE